MSQIGSESMPLRVAIVGAGPAGFYVAEHLFKQKDVVIEVDMFDRLPTPYGLVRAGVAPDHPKIKSVTKVFDRIAGKPGFRFFGNVDLGLDITVKDLRSHYHQIVYTTGAQTDRHLNIPGINLQRSHAATTFVAWYNGHPDYKDFEFDLTQESVAVIGIGNVAVDVARILCRTPDELRQTDIADYALEALSQSKVKDVYMLGRRGPAQGAFTSPELKELGEMEDADVIILEEEAALDEL
ncbi:MAG: FAD-dependent oxidoreductase, partial [Candidatus Promineifilaceae bacterium]